MNSKPTATIEIDGAWAALMHCPAALLLEQVLAVPDPKREGNQAFRDGRWDGLIRLYEGNRFPAGCFDLVRSSLLAEGYKVEVTGMKALKVDLSRFDRHYLPPQGNFKALWPHQVDACLAFFNHNRSCIEAGTGAGKSRVLAAVLRYYWEEFGYRSLVLTSKKGLARQLVDDLREIYGNDLTVGQMGDGQKTRGTVTVGTASTLLGFRGRMYKGIQGDPDEACVAAIEEADVLAIDEAHHAGSAASWFDIALACPAKIRHGLSATLPDPNTLEGLRLLAATGPVVYRKSGASLVEDKLLSKPKIAMVMHENASSPELESTTKNRWNYRKLRNDPVKVYIDDYKSAYDKGVVMSVEHNRAVVRALRWCVDRGRRPVVMCRRKPHWMLLKKMIAAEGLTCDSMWGDTPTVIRDQYKRRLDDGDVQCLLASDILSEGEDIPCIDAIILAEGVKKNIPTLQRIGRGMRRQKGRPDDLWIIDFVPLCYPKLIEHALERTTAYELAGYETLVWEHWPMMVEPGYVDDELLPFLKWEEYREAVLTKVSA